MWQIWAYAKECYSDKCFSYDKVKHFAKTCQYENVREETTKFLTEDVKRKRGIVVHDEKVKNRSNLKDHSYQAHGI